jgi:hypothetical protein
MVKRLLSAVVCAAFLACLWAACPPAVRSQDQLQFPGEVSQWFVNRDGSCVQCSLSNCGVWQNVPQASTLLFDTEYGSKVRGGSGPSRVEAYANRRHIPIWNVTGKNTFDWMRWASKTGRMSAIGCFGSHFQTCLYFDPRAGVEKPWKVRNNWFGTTGTYYEWTEAEFKKNHLASGQWVVILKTPSPPMLPVYGEWWK